MVDFFDDNLNSLNRFDEEAREKLRALSSDIEREVARSLELMQKLEQLHSSISGEPVSATHIGDFSASNSSGDFLSRALDSAISRASSSIVRTGRINGRTVLNAGGRVLGNALGQSIAGSIGRMRLSGSQLGQQLSSELLRGRRNS